MLNEPWKFIQSDSGRQLDALLVFQLLPGPFLCCLDWREGATSLGPLPLVSRTIFRIGVDRSGRKEEWAVLWQRLLQVIQPLQVEIVNVCRIFSRHAAWAEKKVKKLLLKYFKIWSAYLFIEGKNSGFRQLFSSLCLRS